MATSYRKRQSLEPGELIVFEDVAGAERRDRPHEARADRAPTAYHDLRHLLDVLGRKPEPKQKPAQSFVLSPAVPVVEGRGYLGGQNLAEYSAYPSDGGASGGYMEGRGFFGWVYVRVGLTNLAIGASYVVELRVGGRGGTIRVRFEDDSEQLVPGGDRTVPVILQQVASKRVQLFLEWQDCEGHWRFYDAKITALGAG